MHYKIRLRGSVGTLPIGTYTVRAKWTLFGCTEPSDGSDCLAPLQIIGPGGGAQVGAQEPVTIVSEEVAVKVSAMPARSAEPEFSITVSAVRDTVKVGSDLRIDVVETDVSNHRIDLPAAIEPYMCVIEVLDADGKPVPETSLYRVITGKELAPVVNHPAENGRPAWMETSLPMHGGRSVEVLPGETVKSQIEISKLFDLGKPGKYTIKLGADDYAHGATVDGVLIGKIVNSNAITVVITP